MAKKRKITDWLFGNDEDLVVREGGAVSPREPEPKPEPELPVVVDEAPSAEFRAHATFNFTLRATPSAEKASHLLIDILEGAHIAGSWSPWNALDTFDTAEGRKLNRLDNAAKRELCEKCALLWAAMKSAPAKGAQDV